VNPNPNKEPMTDTDPLLTLNDVDSDGALHETEAQALEVAADGHTRSSFLTRGAGLAAGGLVLAGLPVGLAAAQGGLSKGDVTILNYALTLEYLEAAFYAEAVSKGKLSGMAQKFAKVVAGHEAAHVAALRKTLGSKAVKKPSFDFMGTTAKQDTFLKTARVLEDTGVSAYQGQAPNIKAAAVLAAAGSILAVEARHAAWVRDIIGDKNALPAPDAFNEAMSMSAVLSAVKATGFIKS
jgi:rubrerythrin